MKRNTTRYHITIGLILSLLALILLHRGLVLPGLIAFVAGFLLMNGGKMPWSKRK